MSAIALSDFLSLLLSNLHESVTQTATLTEVDMVPTDPSLPEERLQISVSTLELDLPAYLTLERNPSDLNGSTRLMLTLPTLLDEASQSHLGRIRLSIQPQLPV